MINTAYLLLGSNLGNKKENLNKSIEFVSAKVGKLIKKSSIYETQSWGFETKNTFLNQVIKIETTLSSEILLDTILQIENQIGRKRKTSATYESRIIDIDILFYNFDIINQKKLIIPHPELHKRNFTLFPLKEIAEGLIHPVLNKNISELLFESQDECKIIKVK